MLYQLNFLFSGNFSDQMTVQQQQINEEINETKLFLQEELLQQDAAQKKSISGQAAEIATIRSDVNGLKQPKRVTHMRRTKSFRSTV